MSIFVILYIAVNLSLTTAYKAVGVTGEYPQVLPQPASKQAVGYDSSTNSILILGAGTQAVAYHINEMEFEDLGDILEENVGGVQFYTQQGSNLWMINAGGTGFLTFDTHSRSMGVPATTFPTTVSPHACLAAHEHYLFVVGGWNDGQMQHIVQIYNTLNNEWITNMPLTQESRSVCGCVVNSNRLYAVAGLQSDTIEWISIADIPNIDKQEWQYVNGHLPQVLRGNTAVNHGSEIVILGGRSEDHVHSTIIPVVNVDSNSISIKGSLAYSSDEAGAIIVGKRAYIFGGFGDTGEQITSYQYVDISDIVESSGMSGGSIFLLILFISLIVYCVVGYVFNGYKSKEWGDVKGNIPQYETWKYVPLLTYTGCKISYDFVKGKVGGQKQQRIDTDYDEL